MGAEALDPDLFRGGRDHGPDGPVAQAHPDPAALGDRAQQWSLLESDLGHPGIDALPDPDPDGDGADPATLAAEVGND